MKANRFLPAYVTSFRDRHRKVRYRFRRKGFDGGYFTAQLGTEAFRAEYAAFMEGHTDPVQVAIARTIPGSIGDLQVRYFATPDRLGPTEQTRKKVRAVIEGFTTGREDRIVREVTFEHLDTIIAKRRKKTVVNGKVRGGVEAARKLRKELVRFFAFARKLGMRDDNPADDTDRIKVAPADRSPGYYSWTEDDIAKYRARHPLGTRARLAMELMLWTDQRRVDSIHLGRQHITAGRLKITQTKTGKVLQIAVAPQLLEAIVAMPPADSSPMCFLVNDFGKPFTNAGFGNKFREWCDEADLPKCTAHGLRKATMRRMAELDFGQQTMKSMSGHTNDDEVARYTADANQMRMADDAVRRLSAWEKSNLVPRLDTNTAESG